MIQVPTPEWTVLEGGTSEAAWLEDRDRKAALAAEMSVEINRTRRDLERRQAITVATPEVLQGVPFAADWYVSLAGFSLKTLSGITSGPQRAGLKRKPSTVLGSVRSRTAVDSKELESFCRWVNAEINYLFPESPSADEAERRVSLLIGGRIIGQGQNLGGNAAVLSLKTLVRRHLAPRFCEVSTTGGSYEPASDGTNLLRANYLRFGRELVFDFMGGGNRPDMTVTLGDQTLAVAEVKGRKDLSNVWESWMPQVVAHMSTWTQEHPDTARLFFGTVITREMIEGRSAAGTVRVGLRQLYQEGSLQGVFNLTKIAEADTNAATDFTKLMQVLAASLGEA